MSWLAQKNLWDDGLNKAHFFMCLDVFNFHIIHGVYDDLVEEARAKQVKEVIGYFFDFTGGKFHISAVNEKGESITMQRPSK